MKRILTESKNIKSIGWDNEILEIEFNSGHLYQYFPVKVEDFNNIIYYDSLNQWFIDNIRNNKNISYKKIEK